MTEQDKSSLTPRDEEQSSLAARAELIERMAKAMYLSTNPGDEFEWSVEPDALWNNASAEHQYWMDLAIEALEVVEKTIGAETAAPSAWKTIKTAPKDGTHIYALNANATYGFGWFGDPPQMIPEATVVHWWEDGSTMGWWPSVSRDGDKGVPFPATHWQPIVGLSGKSESPVKSSDGVPAELLFTGKWRLATKQPIGGWFVTKRLHEEGYNITERIAEDEWADIEGYTTVTSHAFLPPTHFLPWCITTYLKRFAQMRAPRGKAT